LREKLIILTQSFKVLVSYLIKHGLYTIIHCKVKEIPTTSGNHSVTGTELGFIYKFMHSTTMTSAIFEKILKKTTTQFI